MVHIRKNCSHYEEERSILEKNFDYRWQSRKQTTSSVTSHEDHVTSVRQSKAPCKWSIIPFPMVCRNLCERLYSKTIFGKSRYYGSKKYCGRCDLYYHQFPASQYSITPMYICGVVHQTWKHNQPTTIWRNREWHKWSWWLVIIRDKKLHRLDDFSRAKGFMN